MPGSLLPRMGSEALAASECFRGEGVATRPLSKLWVRCWLAPRAKAVGCHEVIACPGSPGCQEYLRGLRALRMSHHSLTPVPKNTSVALILAMG